MVGWQVRKGEELYQWCEKKMIERGKKCYNCANLLVIGGSLTPPA
jgi:hypothetical protein